MAVQLGTETEHSIIKKIFEREWGTGPPPQSRTLKPDYPAGIMIAFLIDKFTDRTVNVVPLNLAAYYSYPRIVETLLELGADPNKEDVNGENAVFNLAQRANVQGIKKGDEEILKMLLDHGADLDSYEIGRSDITARQLLRRSNLSHVMKGK